MEPMRWRKFIWDIFLPPQTPAAVSSLLAMGSVDDGSILTTGGDIQGVVVVVVVVVAVVATTSMLPDAPVDSPSGRRGSSTEPLNLCG
ncbi:hypothetical protein F5Y15DRAFT_418100 [Xylariaceae sp. FL0016]|nr:hypothetical protein F5Y15DRAFT_418100 [Xylariaceae sp. FL0016]